MSGLGKGGQLVGRRAHVPLVHAELVRQVSPRGSSPYSQTRPSGLQEPLWGGVAGHETEEAASVAVEPPVPPGPPSLISPPPPAELPASSRPPSAPVPAGTGLPSSQASPLAIPSQSTHFPIARFMGAI